MTNRDERDEIRLALAELLEAGEIVDSGEIREGRIVWILRKFATKEQIETSDKKHRIK